MRGPRHIASDSSSSRTAVAAVPCGQRFTPAGRELLEPQHVQLTGRDSQDITGARVASRSSSPSDRSALRSSDEAYLQVRSSSARRKVGPQLVRTAGRQTPRDSRSGAETPAPPACARRRPTAIAPPEVTSRGPRTWNSTLRLSSADAPARRRRGRCEERTQWAGKPTVIGTVGARKLTGSRFT